MALVMTLGPLVNTHSGHRSLEQRGAPWEQPGPGPGPEPEHAAEQLEHEPEPVRQRPKPFGVLSRPRGEDPPVAEPWWGTQRGTCFEALFQPLHNLVAPSAAAAAAAADSRHAC